MKKIMTMLIIVAFASTIMAQEKTLLSGETSNGWYGGLFTKFGPVNGGSGIYMGGQAAWMINHQFGIGGKGYGLVNELAVKDLQNIKLEFGCWGALLEYHIAPHNLVHVSINSMIGAGGVRYSVIDYQVPHDDVDWSDDGFFVFEPGINLDLHVHKNFRIGGGISYRIVNGVNYTDLKNADLNGLTAEVGLKFGIF